MRSGILLRLTFCWALACLLPAWAYADSMSGVGDLSIATLDSEAQKQLAAAGMVGANITANASIVDCNTKAKAAIEIKNKDMAAIMTTSDPTKKLQDGISSCLEKIQTISAAISFPASLSFTALFEAALKQLREKIINEIVMKICTSATNAWNNAVNNAIGTINSGINQSGVNTFGDFVSVSNVPVNPAPKINTPFLTPSNIPGL